MRKQLALASAFGLLTLLPAAAANAQPRPAVTEHYIIDDGGAGYGIDSAAANADYHTATGDGGEFTPVADGTWNGHAMYMWKNSANGFCLTNNAAADDDLDAEGCSDFPAAQAFYYTGSELENEQAAEQANTACLFAVTSGSGANIVNTSFPSGQTCPVSYGTNWSTPVA